MIGRDASNFAEILKAVKESTDDWTPNPEGAEEIWFRGLGCGSHSLLPGLYREANRVFDYDEEDLLERFRVAAFPHVLAGLSEWDWYFLAQHHGIQTRLLDWTGGLVNAVYFALSGLVDIKDRRAYDQARANNPGGAPDVLIDGPAVFLLDAGSLNKHFGGLSDDYVYRIGGEYTDRYLPGAIKLQSSENADPVAILPPKSNARVVAQVGHFTLHGHGTMPLEVVTEQSNGSVKLARIRIDRARVFDIWRELEVIGVSQATVYPGLDSIAAVTRWQCQRPVQQRN